MTGRTIGPKRMCLVRRAIAVMTGQMSRASGLSCHNVAPASRCAAGPRLDWANDFFGGTALSK